MKEVVKKVVVVVLVIVTAAIVTLGVIAVTTRNWSMGAHIVVVALGSVGLVGLGGLAIRRKHRRHPSSSIRFYILFTLGIVISLIAIVTGIILQDQVFNAILMGIPLLLLVLSGSLMIYLNKAETGEEEEEEEEEEEVPVQQRSASITKEEAKRICKRYNMFQ